MFQFAARSRTVSSILVPLALLVCPLQAAPNGAPVKVFTVDNKPNSFWTALAASRRLPPGTPRAIRFRGGPIYLDNTLDLSAFDAGLTLESTPGQHAVLIGGRAIDGWKPVPDSPLWSATLPAVNGRAWRFRALFVNGALAEPARLPEKGFYQDDQPTFVRVPNRPATAEQLTTLKYKNNDLGPWLDTASAELRVYHSWNASTVKVNRVDADSHTLQLAWSMLNPAGAFAIHRYEILNVRQGLKHPGQWFLDYKNNMVYYWPQNGEMPRASIVAPVLDTLIRISGSGSQPARDITIRNLELTVTDAPLVASELPGCMLGGAILVQRAEAVTLSDLKIHDTGSTAIRTVRSRKLQITNNTIDACGSCGIGGPFEYAVHESEFADNRVSRVGLLNRHAMSIHVQGNNNHVHHNAVTDSPYDGFNVGGVANVVEFNTAARTMTLFNDGAAFYLAGSNGIVRNNSATATWLDNPALGEPRKGDPGFAYYLDDRTTGYVVEHNQSTDSEYAVFVHNAPSNIVRDNVFVSARDLFAWVHPSPRSVFERNVFSAQGKIQLAAADDAFDRFADNLFYSAAKQYRRLHGGPAAPASPLNATGNLISDAPVLDNRLQLQASPAASKLSLQAPARATELGPRSAQTRRDQ